MAGVGEVGPLQQSDVQISAHSRRGSNTIQPVGGQGPPHSSTTSLAAPSPPPPPAYREIKHLKKWLSWLIPVFVVANVVMFVIIMYLNNCPKNSVSCVAGFLGRFSFQPFKENPLLGPSSTTVNETKEGKLTWKETAVPNIQEAGYFRWMDTSCHGNGYRIRLEKLGALDVSKVVHEHQGWRLIACMWLHGGVLHLLANMLSLLVIGIRLEQEFGFVHIGLLYVISGLGGSLLSALLLQSNISVGASGALFGLLGGMLSELITNWSIYVNKVASLVTLVVIIAVNLGVGLLPHVDNFAHIGGFSSGFLLGFVFLIRPQFAWVSQRYALQAYPSSPPKHKFKAYQCILWVLSLILLIVGFTLGLVMLLRGVDLNDHCSWCHYLSCVPTSRWSCNTQPGSCLSDQMGGQLTLTCSNNDKTKTYTLQSLSPSQIEGLCTQLCS